MEHVIEKRKMKGMISGHLKITDINLNTSIINFGKYKLFNLTDYKTEYDFSNLPVTKCMIINVL